MKKPSVLKSARVAMPALSGNLIAFTGIVAGVFALFALFEKTARADFIDALPELALTPTPVPTPGGAGKSSSGNPADKSAPTTKSGSGSTSGKKKQGQKPGTPASGLPNSENSGSPTSGSSSTGSASEGGGLFGGDVTKHNANAPISTKGDILEGSLAKGKMTLTGNVEIHQADTVMNSDVAELFSKPGTTTPERAVAKGKVSIKKSPSPTVPEIRAEADELEYFVATRRVVLKGRPKIWRGQELLQGEVIEAELDTGEIKVRGARGVVDPKTQQGSGSGGEASNPFKIKSDKKR